MSFIEDVAKMVGDGVKIDALTTEVERLGTENARLRAEVDALAIRLSQARFDYTADLARVTEDKSRVMASYSRVSADLARVTGERAALLQLASHVTVWGECYTSSAQKGHRCPEVKTDERMWCAMCQLRAAVEKGA
jgi:hypothetical protein